MNYFKEDGFEYQHRNLFPSNVFDLLPDTHECYIYEDLISQLDTSEVEKNYSVIGQHAYHPRLIVGILIYAYSNGVFSSRQIEKQSHENLGFMYVSHMRCPNFRVLSDFRKDNYEFFKDCFRQTVMLAKEAGMVSLGHVSLDGSKFDADSSKHKAMSYKRLKEVEKDLIEEIEELLRQANSCDEEEDESYGDKSGYEICEELLIKEKRLAKIHDARNALEKREAEQNPGKEIDDKKQISFADKESRIMGKKGDFDYRYNGQISTDEKEQIIVGEHLSQNANDKQEVKRALEEIDAATGELPERMSSDNGYMSGENLAEFKTNEVDAYVAVGKGEPGEPTESPKDIAVVSNSKSPSCASKEEREGVEVESEVVDDKVEGEGKFKKSNFSYDIESDTYTCPAGHRLNLKSARKDGKKIYQAEKVACDNCMHREKCCSDQKGEYKSRTIHSDDKEPLRQEMREKMSLEESKEIYKRRKVIVEPVFGQIKNSGFRRFHVRGFKKASGEFSLVCSVHNMKKMVKGFLRGVVCLEGGKLVANRV
jgi:transposase